MPKGQTVKCPSCQEDVTLGKYCLSCGAELVTAGTARLGDDVLDQIADRAAAKMIKALDDRAAKTSPVADPEPKEKEGGKGKLFPSVS